VLPVLYTIWRQRQLRRATALGLPIAAVVGLGRRGAGRDGHGVPTNGTIIPQPSLPPRPTKRGEGWGQGPAP